MERRAGGYDAVRTDVVRLVQEARSLAARSVNQVMTAAYWEIGRRIVEHEQGGAERAKYGEALLARLSLDLTERFGRGFSCAAILPCVSRAHDFRDRVAEIGR